MPRTPEQLDWMDGVFGAGWRLPTGGQQTETGGAPKGGGKSDLIQQLGNGTNYFVGIDEDDRITGEGGFKYSATDDVDSSDDEDVEGDVKPKAKPDVGKSRTFAPVDVSNPSPTGMTGRSVGQEYAGEHNMVGWRTPSQQKKQDTRLTTALNTDEQRKDNTLSMKDGGSFERGEGGSVSNAKLGYAMDPKTGEMVAFDDKTVTFKQTEGGRTDEKKVTSLIQGLQSMAKDKSLRMDSEHHSSVLGGDEVRDEKGNTKLDGENRPIMQSRAAASAGFVQFDFAGKIVTINNSSGHYKPLVSDLMQAVEYLSKQGAFLSDTITNAEGERLDEDDDGFKLYQGVQAKLKSVPSLLQEAEGVTKALADEKITEEERAKQGKALEKLYADVAKIRESLAKPLETLSKLGIGPSQTTRRNAKAEFIDVKAGMTGADVRGTELTSMGVDEFLQSGGGNTEQKDNKDEMLQELEQVLAPRRKKLDQQASTGPQRPEATQEDIEESLRSVGIETQPSNRRDDDPNTEDEEQSSEDSSNKYLMSNDEDEKEGSDATGLSHYFTKTDNVDKKGDLGGMGLSKYFTKIDDEDEEETSGGDVKAKYFKQGGESEGEEEHASGDSEAEKYLIEGDQSGEDRPDGEVAPSDDLQPILEDAPPEEQPVGRKRANALRGPVLPPRQPVRTSPSPGGPRIGTRRGPRPQN